MLRSKGRTRDTGHSLTLRAVHGFLFLYSFALCYVALTTRAETCWFLPPPLQLYISLKTPHISSPLTKTPSCPKKLNLDPSVTKGEPCTACSNSPGLLCGSSTLVTPILANCSSSELSQAPTVLCKALYVVSHGRRAVPVQAEGGTRRRNLPLFSFQLSIHGTYTLLRASDPAAPRETRLPFRGWEPVVE